MRRHLPAITALAVLVAYFTVENRLRQGQEARSLDAGEADRGTTRAIGAAYGVAMMAGPLLSRARRGRLPLAAGWLGVAVMATGLSLRVWAARSLGAFYTRTLRVAAAQPVVVDGPYAYVRHPGYTGVITMWLGYGLSLMSLPALAGVMVPIVLAYTRRVGAEEAMLVGAFGADYRAYQQRTSGLLPGRRALASLRGRVRRSGDQDGRPG